MMINSMASTTVPTDLATWSVVGGALPIAGAAYPVITGLHAVAPKSTGEVRLDDDATVFAGTPAWRPPT